MKKHFELEEVEADAIAGEKYRNLVRHHLHGLPALFRRFTGLFSRVAWAPTKPCRWRARALPTHSQICRELLRGNAAAAARCRACAARHLEATLASGRDGHRFTCFLGVRNFWLPIIVRGCLIGLAFVQALTPRASGAASRRQPVRPVPATAGRKTTGVSRRGSRAARRMSSSDFCEAARLLRLVIRQVEASTVADLRQTDLTQAQRALVELQMVAARLRGELNGLVPAVKKMDLAPVHEKHAVQTARAALESINHGYATSITLKKCAARLGVNAAYLSFLFSRHVGIPFKTYLTEVRMGKAQELLGDPTKTVTEVAYAVGYASQERFRSAFKKATGHCPRVWRETMRVGATPEAASAT